MTNDTIIEIDLDSPAGQELRSLLAEPHGYVIRLAIEERRGEPCLLVKLNGGMWSPPLSTRARRSHAATA